MKDSEPCGDCSECSCDLDDSDRSRAPLIPIAAALSAGLAERMDGVTFVRLALDPRAAACFALPPLETSARHALLCRYQL